MNKYPKITNPDDLNILRVDQGIKLVNKTDNSPGNEIPLSKMYAMPFNVYFLDTDSIVQSANESVVFFAQRNSTNDMIGLTARDISKSETAELCINHDRNVLKMKKMLARDELVIRTDDVLFSFLGIKFPWYDQDNHLIGVFGLSIKVDNEHGFSLANPMGRLLETGLLNASSQHSSFPGYVRNDVYFTEREKQILFHLARGNSAKQIARIMDRSQRTIEHHIENMKFKTKSHTRAELIYKMAN